MSERVEEVTHWWSLADRVTVIDVVGRLRARSVLEFGPGSSTVALVDGGAQRVDAAEDDLTWYNTHQRRLVANYPGVVRIYFYVWCDPLTIPTLDARRYDLGLIDGPREMPRRVATIKYALDHCAAVLVPLEHEDWRERFDGLLGPVVRFAGAGRSIEVIQTGPPSFAMALVR